MAAAATTTDVMASLDQDRGTSNPAADRSTTAAQQQGVAATVLGIVGLIIIGLVIIITVVRSPIHSSSPPTRCLQSVIDF